MLFGRDAELAEIESRVRTNRLVTVVGPAGVGKTALARAAVARLSDRDRLGVHEVDLARIDHADAVAGALAAQLGFSSFDSVLASTSDHPVLLVVDNCEHLLDATAHVVAQLLGACQQPTVVATSRSPLELPGESVLSLAPLALPRVGEDPSTGPAVELFLSRARDGGAVLDDDEIGPVAELCRRLDGLPLAIEIAAARARTMSTTEIERQLSESLEVLDRPRFRGEPRHRSVADAIGWSFRSLTPSRARLLEQLAVFAGPFTADRGRAVVDPDATSSFRGDLDELVNASLVVVEARAGTTRYRLLDTIRRFALDRLLARGELAGTFDRYVDHVADRVQQLLRGATVSWRPGLVRDLVESFDDMAQAIEHTLRQDRAPRRAYRLCGVLWAIVHQARAEDILGLCRATLERWPDDGSPEAAPAVASLATAEYVTGNPQRAVTIAESALARRPDPTGAAITLNRVLGQARRALGDLRGSVEAFRSGAAIGHRLGRTAMAAELDTAAALVTADLGDHDRAVADLERVLLEVGTGTSALTDCWARAALGWVLLRQDTARARPLITEALEQARSVDYPIAVAVGLRSQAYVHLLDGDLTGAVAATQDLFDDLLGRGAMGNARLLFDVAAVVAHRCGHRGWDRLAATARTLPITTLAAADHELIVLPEVTATPLPRHAAVATLRHVLAECAELAASLDPASRAEVPAARSPNPSITGTGDVWEFSFAGHTVAVRSAKGVLDIIRLIEANGQEIHCRDLAGAGVEQRSTGEVIDTSARQQYERRIRDLQAEIEEAEDHSDYERAYRHQVELDALIDHLAAALGHGKRTRRGADTTERARSAVTHRIRTTIRRLDRLHPPLGSHLSHSINTGSYCSYRPEQPTAWEITRRPGP